MTTQSTESILINGFGVLFVIFNAFGLGLRLPIGKLLAQALAHWQIAVWVLVINFAIIPLIFIGYLMTIASSIPDEVKVGFCIAALSAGMPFAPLVARLARADVSLATTMLVILTVATIIALPLGLPLAMDVVDVQLRVSVSTWDIAWPLLLFLLLPLALGIGFRHGWPDLAPSLSPWIVRVAILCLLLNLNFTLFVFWDLFVQTWGTGAYIAALAGPFIGLGCGYILVSAVRFKDVGMRHAMEITTAIRNIGPMLLMMIFPFVAYPLVTVAITILNTIGLVVVLLFALVWRRAGSPAGAEAVTTVATGAQLPEEAVA